MSKDHATDYYLMPLGGWDGDPTDAEQDRQAALTMAEAALRIETWRKKGRERAKHDLVTVLLLLGVIDEQSPEHAERMARIDWNASWGEEHRWKRDE